MTIKKKIIMLGDSAVGKTSMVKRFVYDIFEDSYISTIGSKVTKKEMIIQKREEEVELNLVIWDILGRVGYNASHARAFAGVDGAILISDLTRKETLKSLERYWIPLLLEVVENVPLVFASNKHDLIDGLRVDEKEMLKISSRYNIGIMESLPPNLSINYMTSAKTGANVENIFKSLGHLLLSDKILEDPIKELYESLVAHGIYRQTDKKTLIGATDALIVDFCEECRDEKKAMSILRQEVVRAHLDINQPKKEGLMRLVEFLADAETEYKNKDEVINNRKRRLSLAQGAK
jgi:small GTP-binding protein